MEVAGWAWDGREDGEYSKNSVHYFSNFGVLVSVPALII